MNTRNDSYTIDRARFSDHLEVIKFICKEFWNELFKKHVDNLKTNRNRSGDRSLQHLRTRSTGTPNWCVRAGSIRTARQPLPLVAAHVAP
eukprot:1195485-Prorocentrum_minimum.AAC.3